MFDLIYVTIYVIGGLKWLIIRLISLSYICFFKFTFNWTLTNLFSSFSPSVMDIIYSVRDTLEINSTSDDIEVKALIAAAKAMEFIKCTSSQKRRKTSIGDLVEKKRAKLSPEHPPCHSRQTGSQGNPSPNESNQGEGIVEISDNQDDEEEDLQETDDPTKDPNNNNNNNNHSQAIIPPQSEELDTEEDMFNTDFLRASTPPIKNTFKSQQDTEQLRMLESE